MMTNTNGIKENSKYLILVMGLPASGKTTIAKRLANEFGLHYIGKDEYKIKMYEEYGFSSTEEKKALDDRSEELMYSDLCSLMGRENIVVFDKWICKDFSRIDSITKLFNVKVIAIYLTCDADIATKRYNNRILAGSRHVGLSLQNKYPFIQGESEFKYASIEEMIKRSEFFAEKSFGDYRFEVSTNDIENYENIYKQIKNFIVNIIKE